MTSLPTSARNVDNTPDAARTDVSLPTSVRHFDSMPDAARIDVTAVALITGRSKASVWRDVQAGRLPAPVKSGLRCTRWVVGDLRKALQVQQGGAR